MSDRRPEGPVLRIVRGAPTDAELAALVSVLEAVRAASDGRPPTRRSTWNAPARAVRRPTVPGPDGWRASARPF